MRIWCVIENKYMILISLSAQPTIYFKNKSFPHFLRVFYMYCIPQCSVSPFSIRYVLIITGIQLRGSSKVKFYKAPSLIFFFNGTKGASIKNCF